MLKNYLRIAFRNMAKQRMYSAINLMGLAITLLVCIFIFSFVKDELSYDRCFKNYDRMYRLIGVEFGHEKIGRAVVPWSEAMKEIPEIESYTRMWDEKTILRQGNAGFMETVSIVDSTFFYVFPFQMIYGNPHYALNDPHSAVLSQELAEKLFGRENPVGRSIMIKLSPGIDTVSVFTVSGVAARVPDNSSIRFSVLIPYSNMKFTSLGMMGAGTAFNMISYCGISNLGPSSFLKLRSATEKDQAQNLLQKFAEKFLPPFMFDNSRFVLQPITQIHLSPDIAYSMQSTSKPEYSYILIGLGALILVLSSINFMNLTIARASHRFKEIGIRKVLGSSRQKLFIQFMSDAMLLSLLALMVALTLAELTLPVFNELAGKHLALNLYKDRLSFLGAFSISILVGLMSGLYPAAYLSKFTAANVLKGEHKLSGRKAAAKFIMGFQFVVSVGLAICAVIMMEQSNYLQSKNLGFDKENVVVVEDPSLILSEFMVGASSSRPMKTFIEQISNYDGIKSVTWASEMPGHFRFSSKVACGTDTANAGVFVIGSKYLKTFDMKLADGRDFSSELSNDTTENVIVNETMVRELGLKQALGKIITSDDSYLKGGKGRIVGVVKDFNFESLESPVIPAMLVFSPSSGWTYVFIRLRQGNRLSTMASLKKKWNEVYPGMPFEYHFLDDYLNNLYESAQRWNKIVNYAATFAILLALMGLFGLTSYMVESRTKELGIRKILGARYIDIGGLIYGEFFAIVLVAAALACPIAWYFMHRWLENFAYRVDITMWPFLVASLAILLTTIAVTLVHVVKAATANPIESLRYE